MTGAQWLWTVLGALLLTAAGAALARFAVGDRPRRRRRCPRCWYDMSGEIDSCPECGRKVRSARELTRTRRPFRWLLLAILLFGGSLAAGWQTAPLRAARLVPDRALIAGMERFAGGTLGNELFGRLRRGELSQAAQHGLILKSTRLLERSTDAEVLKLAGHVLSDAETFGRTISPKGYFPWAVAPTECVAPERLVRALTPLLGHEDPEVRDAAASALSDLAPAAAVLVPRVLVLCAGDPSKHSRAVVDAHFNAAFEPLRRTLADATLRPEEHAGLLDFATTLAELPAETEMMRATMLDALANDNEEVAALAAWMLRTCYRDDDECRLHALATYDPTRSATAPILLSYALRGPLDDSAAQVIREALSSVMRSTGGWRCWGWPIGARTLRHSFPTLSLCSIGLALSSLPAPTRRSGATPNAPPAPCS